MYKHLREMKWLGDLGVRRLPWDRKVAGSILISSDGIIFFKIEFVIFLSHWSLGSDIRRLAHLDYGDKQEVCVHVNNLLAVGNIKE
jgi:hypothetical protein